MRTQRKRFPQREELIDVLLSERHRLAPPTKAQMRKREIDHQVFVKRLIQQGLTVWEAEEQWRMGLR